MTGISILIVDDDKLLVEKLKKTMNWEQLGISAVFTAYNIRQARTVIEEYPIHIMLCDIDMPQGSGLELLEWIRERDEKIECVFLSGYAIFAYAQLAVRLDSRDFLLKPISNAELEHSLQRTVSFVKKKRKNMRLLAGQGRMSFWEDLLMIRIPESICIRDALEKNVCRPDERFYLILMRVPESAEQVSQNKDYAILDFAVRNISYEYFEYLAPEVLEAVIHISNLEWMFVLKDCGKDMDVLVKGLSEALKSGNNRQIMIYQGRSCVLEEIGTIRERLEDMEQNAVMNEEGILKEENWEQVRKKYIQPPWSMWEQEMIQSRDLSDCADKILTYLDHQKVDGGWNKQFMRQFIRELVQMLYHYLYSKDLKYSQIFDDKEFNGYEKLAADSETAVKEFVRYIFVKLEGNEELDVNRKDVVQHLKTYIDQHLGENLSRMVLAQEVYLSEGYISKLFFRETGSSLVNYIAERRIEKAKEYLVYTSLPISKIAIEVGYNNFSYFSKTFRDLTGYTPNEYRTMQQK